MKFHIEQSRAYTNDWLCWSENRMIGQINSRKSGRVCKDKEEVKKWIDENLPEVDEEVVKRIDKAKKKMDECAAKILNEGGLTRDI